MKGPSINNYAATGPNARVCVLEWWDDLVAAGKDTGEVEGFGRWAAWDGSSALAVTDHDGFREVMSFPSIREAKAYFDTLDDNYAEYINNTRDV